MTGSSEQMRDLCYTGTTTIIAGFGQLISLIKESRYETRYMSKQATDVYRVFHYFRA
jgi:hypothetical protein